MRRARVRRGWAVAALALVAAISVVAAVVVSPWLMRSAAGEPGDWQELSNIGQAYGGVSAVLSGLAFCGIAGSLVLQWRQVRLVQRLAERERHFELVKMAVEDPLLMFDGPAGMSDAEKRQRMNFNLWVSHWEMLWQTGSISRHSLRTVFDEMFENDLACAWWASAVGWRQDDAKRFRAFVAIADEAHREAESKRLVGSRLRAETQLAGETLLAPSSRPEVAPEAQ